jgi:hypothetical protein
MPIVDLTDDELAAVAAAIRRLLEEDKFPRARALIHFAGKVGRGDGGAATTATTPATPPDTRRPRSSPTPPKPGMSARRSARSLRARTKKARTPAAYSAR